MFERYSRNQGFIQVVKISHPFSRLLEKLSTAEIVPIFYMITFCFSKAVL